MGGRAADFPRAGPDRGACCTAGPRSLKISEKTGATGRMVFVTVRHEIASGGDGGDHRGAGHRLCRHARTLHPAAAPSRARGRSSGPKRCAIDTVRLFRFSAVTFNAHRIHFDLDYAQQVEKYPGLVVHGPVAGDPADGGRAAAPRRGTDPASYRFRGVRPLFHFDSAAPGRAPEAPRGGRRWRRCRATGWCCMQAEVGWQGAA